MTPLTMPTLMTAATNEAIRAAGLRPIDVATAMAISRQAVSRYMNVGWTHLGINLLCEATEVTLADIVERMDRILSERGLLDRFKFTDWSDDEDA